MSEQLQKERATHRRDDWEGVESVPAKPQATSGSTDIDELLDDIDELLEENAEDVVAAYVQRGGQ